jgi:hypothetical protein
MAKNGVSRERLRLSRERKQLPRERQKVEFKPQFEGPISGWAANYIKKNYWRVAGYLEFEDLIQDAYWKFLVCRDAYPHVIEPQHFMALFKKAYINHFTDLSNARTATPDYIPLQRHPNVDANKAENIEVDVVGELNNAGPVLVAFSELPEEARMLLDKLFEISAEQIEGGKDKKTRIGRGLFLRETTNECLCRLVGADPKKINLATYLNKLKDALS